ncbi:Beta-tectorin [Nibea albiflora]|uniref:Beta-tectorin n=1 Tax=Nibea albiflora TaxID=240163 RepID=A0ACB7F2S0_NIBAL|nr:Beta-tectorin [Nibea albiflora]
MLGNLWMLCLCLCFSRAEARIWAWMLNMPHSPPKEGAKALRESAPLAKVPTAVCDHDRACGRGFSCDRHFGLCVPLRGEGHYCRRDAQCVRGLSCMFGKCHRSIPNGQEGARCKVDRDCGASMCCARHHGEQVCKRRLIRGESCYVPAGGLAFSINQICPCDEGLLCRENSASHQRDCRVTGAGNLLKSHEDPLTSDYSKVFLSPTDYVMVSCFPNAIIANVPECPYGWEIEQLSLGGVCYSGIHSPGFYRFIISDLTPKNHSYCGTQSEVRRRAGNQPVNYTFSCMYRAAYLVNNAVFSQRVATVYVNNGSLGTFRSQLSMNVFTNSKFLYAKDAPYVIDTSEIGSEVFIGIEAKGLSNRFKVVINNCWATPTPYSTDKKRWSLIINSCSADNTVTIFENAKDSRSMFKFNSFRFQRLEKVSTVWLHCEVQVCDGDRLNCQPGPCSHRSLASVAEPSGGILTTEFHIKVSGSSNNGHIKGKHDEISLTDISCTWKILDTFRMP